MITQTRLFPNLIIVTDKDTLMQESHVQLGLIVVSRYGKTCQMSLQLKSGKQPKRMNNWVLTKLRYSVQIEIYFDIFTLRNHTYILPKQYGNVLFRHLSIRLINLIYNQIPVNKISKCSLTSASKWTRAFANSGEWAEF